MNTTRNRWGIRRSGLMAVGMVAAALSFAAALAPASAQNAAAPKKDAKTAAEPAKNFDVLIFKSGRTVEGVILEETAGTVKIKIVSKGGLSVETSYDKSEILEIQRGKGSAITADGKPDPAAAKPDEKSAPKPDASSGDQPTVYVVNLTGELGRDVGVVSLRDVMNDVKKYQPQVLIFKVDMDFKYMGEEIPDFANGAANAAFNQLETVRELQTMLTDEIRDNPEWTTKPRLVMWVRKALGGSAFFPFIAPEIYFTSDGRHGGMGYLEKIFDGVGDKVAQEKQYSLRLVRAEGLAIKGSHEPKLLRAMARADYVLSVDFVGGKPVYRENTSGEMLLTDDAKDANKDTIQDVVRFRGNDVLTLDAPLAERLGLSLGTVDTLPDLLARLGVDKGYTLIEGRADDIIKNWGRAVSDAHVEFRRLWREYQRVPTGGGNFDERQRNRGRQVSILSDMLSLLNRFGDALNPRELNGFPENWKTELSIMIDRIKNAMRLDQRR